MVILILVTSMITNQKVPKAMVAGEVVLQDLEVLWDLLVLQELRGLLDHKDREDPLVRKDPKDLQGVKGIKETTSRTKRKRWGSRP